MLAVLSFSARNHTSSQLQQLKLHRTFFSQLKSPLHFRTMTVEDNNYKPYQLSDAESKSDWVADLELDSAFKSGVKQDPIKVLILYGSLRTTSYSRFLAYEFARILDKLGADVKVFDPTGLPVKDDISHNHPKVQELRELSTWSQAQVWSCPEQHGAITAVFKNQIDWIPLSIGSVRPTQGRVLAVAQVSGGSQSFNTVNTLRLLGRWMRMFTIPNQSSVPKAWTEFDANGRMKDSSLRDRVVDVAEELFRMTLILRPHNEELVNRYSERKEKLAEGRLLTQLEKEAQKLAI
jgi:arsenic resistance protein ArsH